MLVATARDERLILEDCCSVQTLCARVIAAASTSGYFWARAWHNPKLAASRLCAGAVWRSGSSKPQVTTICLAGLVSRNDNGRCDYGLGKRTRQPCQCSCRTSTYSTFSWHTPSLDDVEQSLEVCFLFLASLPYANTRTCIKKKNVCCSPLEVLFFWNIYAHNASSRATTIFFSPLLWRRTVFPKCSWMGPGFWQGAALKVFPLPSWVSSESAQTASEDRSCLLLSVVRVDATP